MSISYEEALATLQAMFGEPWTRATLDAVLRHEKGHMENTCELILAHGDKDPQVLVDRLKNRGPEPQVAMDEELARQLASQQGGGRGGSTSAAGRPAVNPNAKKGRGTPTTLPEEFLRIPGYKRSAAATVAAGGSAVGIDDETLARMLQDELFAEELARNPDFAHLARGGGRGRSAAARTTGKASSAGGVQAPSPFEGLNVMQAISGKFLFWRMHAERSGVWRQLRHFLESELTNLGKFS